MIALVYKLAMAGPQQDAPVCRCAVVGGWVPSAASAFSRFATSTGSGCRISILWDTTLQCAGEIHLCLFVFLFCTLSTARRAVDGTLKAFPVAQQQQQFSAIMKFHQHAVQLFNPLFGSGTPLLKSYMCSRELNDGTSVSQPRPTPTVF
jgi:hypothetical protein